MKIQGMFYEKNPRNDDTIIYENIPPGLHNTAY